MLYIAKELGIACGPAKFRAQGLAYEDLEINLMYTARAHHFTLAFCDLDRDKYGRTRGCRWCVQVDGRPGYVWAGDAGRQVVRAVAVSPSLPHYDFLLLRLSSGGEVKPPLPTARHAPRGGGGGGGMGVPPFRPGRVEAVPP
jgi:hypothetical protein